MCQVIDLSLLYYFFNAHGDVTRQAGTLANKTPLYEYDAFGNQRQPKGRLLPAGPATDGIDTDPNPFRYCGEYYSSETEEYYLRARTYNSANGRFATEDPAKDGDNWYGYCGNAPVIRSDPSGLGAIWDWIKDTANSIVSGVKKAVSNVVSSVKAAVSTVIRGAKTVANSIVSDAKAAVNNVVSGAKRVASSVAGGIRTAVNVITGSYTSPQTQARNYANNAPLSSISNRDGIAFIYGQSSNANFASMKMGAAGSGSANGCGIVATYNAMQIMGKQANVASMITDFEKRGGMRFGGVGGVWGGTIAEYLNDNGVNASYSPFAAGGMFDDIIKNNGAVILYYAWGRIGKMGMHYITLEYRPDLDPTNPYVIYNVSNGKTTVTSCPSFDTYIKNGGYVPISYITVN